MENTRLCSSCRTIKPIIAFQSNQKTCFECSNWINESRKRKREGQILNDICKQKENTIKSKELKHIIYEKLMDVEGESNMHMNLEIVVIFWKTDFYYANILLIHSERWVRH